MPKARLPEFYSAEERRGVGKDEGSEAFSTAIAAKPGFDPPDSSIAPSAMICSHGIKSDIITWDPPFPRFRFAGTSPSQMPAAS